MLIVVELSRCVLIVALCGVEWRWTVTLCAELSRCVLPIGAELSLCVLIGAELSLYTDPERMLCCTGITTVWSRTPLAFVCRHSHALCQRDWLHVSVRAAIIWSWTQARHSHTALCQRDWLQVSVCAVIIWSWTQARRAWGPVTGWKCCRVVVKHWAS